MEGCIYKKTTPLFDRLHWLWCQGHTERCTVSSTFCDIYASSKFEVGMSNGLGENAIQNHNRRNHRRTDGRAKYRPWYEINKSK